ncbi:MAG: site-2 protease family protein [Magnetospirillum sp.]|nr:site-2 protease family protein [Magnetospirillum sp.]
MFAHRITLFTLRGIRVQIDASWLLLAVLIAWSLAVGYFPFAAPGLSAGTYWTMAMIGLIGLAASIIVHEFAHAIVARRHAMPVHDIVLFVFGGIAEMSGEPSRAKDELLMALAGPATSVVLAGIFYGVGLIAAGGLGPGHPLAVVLAYLVFINLLLAAFNMVPAYPLDGGRALRAVLWLYKRDIVQATRIAAAVGSIFAFLLMAFGIASLFAGYLITGLWWLLIGMFVRAAAVGGFRQQVAQAKLSGLPVSRFMRRDPVAVVPDLSLDHLIGDYFYRFYFKSFPVTENGRLVGYVSVEQVKSIDRARWHQQKVGDVMEPCGPENTVSEDSEAVKALGMMQRTGRSRLFVARGDQLAGVLSLRDLLNYLSLRLDLEGEAATTVRA